MESADDLLSTNFFILEREIPAACGLRRRINQEPMRGSCCGYEGLTQYYGVIWRREAAVKPEGLREYLASTAAYLNDRQAERGRFGRCGDIRADFVWRKTAGNSWRRSVDYYDESTLIWLEVDTLIREKTGGKKSLDDFAGHHGGEGNEPKLIPYTLDDVAAALNGVLPTTGRSFCWSA